MNKKTTKILLSIALCGVLINTNQHPKAPIQIHAISVSEQNTYIANASNYIDLQNISSNAKNHYKSELVNVFALSANSNSYNLWKNTFDEQIKPSTNLAKFIKEINNLGLSKFKSNELINNIKKTPQVLNSTYDLNSYISDLKVHIGDVYKSDLIHRINQLKIATNAKKYYLNKAVANNGINYVNKSNFVKFLNYLSSQTNNNAINRRFNWFLHPHNKPIYELTWNKINKIKYYFTHNKYFLNKSLYSVDYYINKLKRNANNLRKEAGLDFLRSKKLTSRSYYFYTHKFLYQNHAQTYKHNLNFARWMNYLNQQTKYINRRNKINGFFKNNLFGLNANTIKYYKNSTWSHKSTSDSIYAINLRILNLKRRQKSLRLNEGFAIIKSTNQSWHWKNAKINMFKNRNYYKNYHSYVTWKRNFMNSLRNWIVVERSKQILLAYKQGHLVKVFNVVTGDHTKHRDTPYGVWALWSKAMNVVLKGSTVGTGPDYDYNIPVKYWMPIDKTGVGLHSIDADEITGVHGRVYWGKDAYLTGRGSHGCVNMHTPDAAWIYHNMPLNTKVYVK